jgi:hypothetical protein
MLQDWHSGLRTFAALSLLYGLATERRACNGQCELSSQTKENSHGR